jgi:hypothetical protein
LIIDDRAKHRVAITHILVIVSLIIYTKGKEEVIPYPENNIESRTEAELQHPQKRLRVETNYQTAH